MMIKVTADEGLHPLISSFSLLAQSQPNEFQWAETIVSGGWFKLKQHNNGQFNRNSRTSQSHIGVELSIERANLNPMPSAESSASSNLEFRTESRTENRTESNRESKAK